MNLRSVSGRHRVGDRNESRSHFSAKQFSPFPLSRSLPALVIMFSIIVSSRTAGQEKGGGVEESLTSPSQNIHAPNSSPDYAAPDSLHQQLTAACRLSRTDSMAALSKAWALLEQNPDFGPGMESWIELSVAAHRAEQAQTILEQRTNQNSADALAWFGLAVLAERQGDVIGSLIKSKRALDSGCRYWKCWLLPAKTYEAIGDSRAGEQYFIDQGNTGAEDPELLGMRLLALAIVNPDDQQPWLNHAVSRLEPGNGREEALLRRASYFRKAGKNKAAIADAESALRTLEKLSDVRRYGQAALLAGRLHETLEEKKKAAKRFNQAHEAFREIADVTGMADAMSHLALLRQTQEQWRESTIYLERALSFYRFKGRWQEEGSVLTNLSTAEAQSGQLTLALEHARQARKLHQQHKNRRGEAFALASLGLIHRKLGEPQRALHFVEQALLILREEGDPGKTAEVLLNVGSARAELGLYGGALDAYQEAFDVYHKMAQPLGEAHAQQNLGMLFRFMGDSERSERLYQEALLKYRAAGNRSGEAAALSALGLIACEKGKAVGAMSHFEEALLLYRDLGDHTGVVNVLTNIANLHRQRDDFDTAAEWHRQALELSREKHNRRLEGRSAGAFGQTLLHAGHLAEAERMLLAAVDLLHASGDSTYEWVTLAALAEVQENQGRMKVASQTLGRTLDLAESVLGRIDDIDLEASLFNTPRLIRLYTDQLRLLLQSTPSGSAPDFETLDQSFRLAEIARSRSLRRRLGWARAAKTHPANDVAQLRLMEAESALFEARAALAAPEPQRRVLADFLMARLKPSFQQALSSGKPLDPQSLGHEEDLRALIEDRLDPKRRAELLKELTVEREDTYQAALRQARGRRKLREDEPPSLTHVQAALPPNHILAAYLLGERESYLWLVGPRTARLERLPPEAEIITKIESYRSLLVKRTSSLSRIKKEGENLYRVLFGGGLGEAAPGTHLVIMPDGALGRLPFETLVRPGSDDLSSAYLALSHPVLYLSSMRGLIEGRVHFDEPAPEGPMLSIAPPERTTDCAGQSALCRPLPNALKEIRCIARQRSRELFSASLDVQLSSRETTGQRVKSLNLNRFSILHFAAHGLADLQTPSRSALLTDLQRALASQNFSVGHHTTRSDGTLDLREIIDLELNGQMVVLSACDTAVGRLRHGEGVESLARAFLIAGAKSVVSTLWAVEDSSTALFASRFHALAKTKPVAEALQQVRREFLTSTLPRGLNRECGFGESVSRLHPYYWAPFVLVSGG